MTGRPSSYTPEVADKICERIAEGESLRTICLDADMPHRATVFRWLSNQSFRDQYTRAKEEQAETLADEIVAISDEPPPITPAGSTDSGHVAWQRNRVEARKWVAAKLKPKKYGEKVQTEVSGPDGGPIQSTLDVSGLPSDVLSAILKAKDASDRS